MVYLLSATTIAPDRAVSLSRNRCPSDLGHGRDHRGGATNRPLDLAKYPACPWDEAPKQLADSEDQATPPPDSLATIGFALMAFDRFVWEGDDVLGDVIADWSCPAINYELTLANVGRFRRWLFGVEKYPTKPTLAHDCTESRLISIRRKITTHDRRVFRIHVGEGRL